MQEALIGLTMLSVLVYYLVAGRRCLAQEPTYLQLKAATLQAALGLGFGVVQVLGFDGLPGNEARKCTCKSRTRTLWLTD